MKSLIGPRTRMIIRTRRTTRAAACSTAEDMATLRRADARYRHRRARRRGSRAHLLRGQHQSLCRHPELAARSIVVSSRQDLSHHRLEDRLRGRPAGADDRVPQVPSSTCYCQHTRPARPRQNTCRTPRLPSRLVDLLPAEARFLPPKADEGLTLRTAACRRGTYFQLARYDAISQQPDREFAEWMTRGRCRRHSVSVFTTTATTSMSCFCFMKRKRRWRPRARSCGRFDADRCYSFAVGDCLTVGQKPTSNQQNLLWMIVALLYGIGLGTVLPALLFPLSRSGGIAMKVCSRRRTFSRSASTSSSLGYL